LRGPCRETATDSLAAKPVPATWICDVQVKRSGWSGLFGGSPGEIPPETSTVAA